MAIVVDVHDRVWSGGGARALHRVARTALAAAFGEDGYSTSAVGIRYALSAAP